MLQGSYYVSNRRPLKCFFSVMFWVTSKKHQRSALLALCEGNPPVTGGFPSQRASNAESVSILWRHHATVGWCRQLKIILVGDKHTFISHSQCHAIYLGTDSISHQTSYRKISQSPEGARSVVRVFQLLGNLSGALALLLPRSLPKLKAIRTF